MAADPQRDPLQLTIDQLAQRTGITARNVRAYQSRGLLPPPALRGRTGYYGPEHVARLELIKELQADGFNLELIRRLFDSGSSAEVTRFARVLRTPFVEEQPQVVDPDELAQQWGTTDPELLLRAEQLGLLRPLEDGRYEATSSRLMQAGAELAALGLSADQALTVFATLRRHADSVAQAFTELFLNAVWNPFENAGRPEERWPEIGDALERLRPLASESLLAVFQLSMSEAVDQAFGRELKRITESLREDEAAA